MTRELRSPARASASPTFGATQKRSRRGLMLAATLGAVAISVLCVGCVQGNTNASSDAGADGGSCDGKGSCSECYSCAAANPCASELSACQASSSCVAIDECMQICGVDQQCREQCYLSNPYGVDLYEAALDCLYCIECASDCSGHVPCT